MRQKRPALVITFDTTSEAIAMEKFCMAQGITGRLIPLPGEISAGCGLAWKTLPSELEEIEKKMEDHQIRWSSMYTLDL